MESLRNVAKGGKAAVTGILLRDEDAQQVAGIAVTALE